MPLSRKNSIGLGCGSGHCRSASELMPRLPWGLAQSLRWLPGKRWYRKMEWWSQKCPNLSAVPTCTTNLTYNTCTDQVICCRMVEVWWTEATGNSSLSMGVRPVCAGEVAGFRGPSSNLISNRWMHGFTVLCQGWKWYDAEQMSLDVQPLFCGSAGPDKS